MHIFDPHFLPSYHERVRKYNNLVTQSTNAIEAFRTFLDVLKVPLSQENEFKLFSFNLKILPKAEKSLRKFHLLFCLVEENEFGRKKLTEVGRLNYSHSGSLLDDVEFPEFYHSLIQKAEEKFELVDLHWLK